MIRDSSAPVSAAATFILLLPRWTFIEAIHTLFIRTFSIAVHSTHVEDPTHTPMLFCFSRPLQVYICSLFLPSSVCTHVRPPACLCSISSKQAPPASYTHTPVTAYCSLTPPKCALLVSILYSSLHCDSTN
uniref:Uncharacterized protein n=1 Tax=Trypanosoma vivax (strain Y486) TaxID=1055687 RepID=G0U4R9_TRYVY|nr:hypothetical protein, conserved in T. vivax [Trypanosoma vivax Y486]